MMSFPVVWCLCVCLFVICYCLFLFFDTIDAAAAAAAAAIIVAICGNDALPQLLLTLTMLRQCAITR